MPTYVAISDIPARFEGSHDPARVDGWTVTSEQAAKATGLARKAVAGGCADVDAQRARHCGQPAGWRKDRKELVRRISSARAPGTSRSPVEPGVLEKWHPQTADKQPGVTSRQLNGGQSFTGAIRHPRF